MTVKTSRAAVDRCPGVLRPWIADDGALVRLRLVGGSLETAALRRLMAVAARFGDGTVYLTSRANLQIRGIAASDGCVPEPLVDEIVAAGLLPSRSHELVRNIQVSPLTGRRGGVADLRPVAHALDARLCAEPRLATLAGRFLFSLDDGRGDVSGRRLDLGLVATDATHAQLRVGSRHWGPVVPLADAPHALLDLATRFIDIRGDGPTALWHVDELAGGGTEILGTPHPRDDRTRATTSPAAFGAFGQDDGRRGHHVDVPDGALTPDLASHVLALATAGRLVVTPWRSIVVPDLEPS